MNLFNISDNKFFRNKIEEIRQSEEYGFICSEAGYSGGYWIPETYKEVQQTLDHLYKRSLEILKTYAKLKHKVKAKGI